MAAMSQVATFQIDRSFNFSKGFVLAGDFTSGVLRSGLFIKVLHERRVLKLRIKSVEFIDGYDSNKQPLNKIGLIVSAVDPGKQRLLPGIRLMPQFCIVIDEVE